jgi:hypothetical protein
MKTKRKVFKRVKKPAYARLFSVYDAKTHELLHSTLAANAQQAYEAWRLMDLRPVEMPDIDACVSEDEEIRAQAYRSLVSTDTWIDDDEVYIQTKELVR